MFGFRRRKPVNPPVLDKRDTDLARLARETFDLLIIGGGITGATIARDAALRGLSVALIEKNDFASGTSSRSSKLVHGGLRYLKGRHVRLVRESLRERGVLLKIAPHLVEPAPFFLPVYAGGKDGRLKLRLGLTAYDLLAGFGDIGRHTVLSREKMLEAEPLLRAEGLQGGFRYFDCVVDDGRLTLATVRSAVQQGALALNYVEATGLERDGERVTGVFFRDVIGGGSGNAHARVIVNAAGPWSDRLREMAGVAGILRPSKGVHLVVPRSRLGLTHVIVIPRLDRVFFAVPTGDSVYVGTTDTDFKGDPGAVRIDSADAAYVLDSTNALFSDAQLTTADVVAGWAGVRPLVAKEGTPLPSDVSRDFEIDPGPEGFYTIAGGKLTTSRAMAEALLDRVIAQEGARFDWRPTPCRTGQTPIFGGNVEGFERYAQAAAASLVGSWGIPLETAPRLVRTHGTEHVALLACARRDAALLRPLSDACPVLRAEAVYAAEQEMAMTLGDFMERRTKLMLFDPDHGLDGAEEAARLIGDVLGWSPRERQRQLSLYRDDVAAMTAFAKEPPSVVDPASG
ncbi:MAG: glycerol-3-phosphate dehydrogenase/oxidase [Dehalococcoidia bacterium]|jgi:glycerol-3-phosphate dehydrogenase